MLVTSGRAVTTFNPDTGEFTLATAQEHVMKAIVQDKFGPPDVLELREVDEPQVGDG
jgi:hypothetical protein